MTNFSLVNRVSPAFLQSRRRAAQVTQSKRQGPLIYKAAGMMLALRRTQPALWQQSVRSASTQISEILYTAEATATGGRAGEVRSADGNVVHKMTLPRGLGGSEELNSTNPETLFAAGYSACFLSAMNAVAGQQKKKLPETSNVTGLVHIGKAGPGFGLAVELKVRIPGYSKSDIEAIIQAAHKMCPYSNATRGNIDVKLDALTEQDTG